MLGRLAAREPDILRLGAASAAPDSLGRSPTGVAELLIPSSAPSTKISSFERLDLLLTEPPLIGGFLPPGLVLVTFTLPSDCAYLGIVSGKVPGEPKAPIPIPESDSLGGAT